MQCNEKLNKNNSGFSLVELLVAVIILALVTAPFLSSFVTASKTNLKSKKMEVSNEISQEIIERFKGSDINYMINTYGMTNEKDAYGVDIDGSYIVEGISSSDAVLGNKHKNYKVDISLKATSSIANGTSTPVIDNISSDACAFLSYVLFSGDKNNATAAKKEVIIELYYDDGTVNPANMGYHVKTDVTYKDPVGNTVGVGGSKDEIYTTLPVVYVAYKPFSSMDVIEFKNNLTDAQLGGEKVQLYLLNQSSYGTNLDEANIKIYEAAVGINNISLKMYNHEGTYTNDLLYTNIITNMVTTVNNTKCIQDTVRMEKVDYIYELKVTVYYGDKKITTVTATKNTVG